MNKTIEQPVPLAGSREGEDPVWGDLVAGFFGGASPAMPSATAPAHEDNQAPVAKKAARKRSGLRA